MGEARRKQQAKLDKILGKRGGKNVVVSLLDRKVSRPVVKRSLGERVLRGWASIFYRGRGRAGVNNPERG